MATGYRRILRLLNLAWVEPERAVRELRRGVVGQYGSLQGSQLGVHQARVPGIPNEVQKAQSSPGKNYDGQSFGGNFMALVFFQAGVAHTLCTGTDLYEVCGT
jgi:hypothetical protein